MSIVGKNLVLYTVLFLHQSLQALKKLCELFSNINQIVSQFTRHTCTKVNVSSFVAELKMLSEHYNFKEGLTDDKVVFGLHTECIQKRLLI